jgi:hypothetical protein
MSDIPRSGATPDSARHQDNLRSAPVSMDDYEEARGSAQGLPTSILHLWERGALRRLSRTGGGVPWPEVARLMGVRSVLRERVR